MKKSFINTALALGITMTGVATTGHAANAAEMPQHHTQQGPKIERSNQVKHDHNKAEEKRQDKKVQHNENKQPRHEQRQKWNNENRKHHDKKITTKKAPQNMPQNKTKSTSSTSSGSTTSSSSSYADASASVKSILAAIAQRESGGDITAINASSGAAGKYQFLQSTWDTVAPAAWKGKSPASAPESVQDDAALALYNLQGTAPWGV